PCHLGSLLRALRPDAEAAPFELAGGTNLVGETEAVGPVFFTGAPGAVPGEVKGSDPAVGFDFDLTREVSTAGVAGDADGRDLHRRLAGHELSQDTEYFDARGAR